MTAPLFEKLGFDAQDVEEHVTPYHRNIILDINCRLGNQECIDTAQEKLESFRNNPSKYSFISIFTQNPQFLKIVVVNTLWFLEFRSSFVRRIDRNYQLVV